jgi:NAD-dependent SIR2 family protein deacetylase
MIFTKLFHRFHTCKLQCFSLTRKAKHIELHYDVSDYCSFNRALVELQRRGILKYLVSQNCDGLHLRSGMHANHLAELHGNMNLEKCAKCNAKYLRDFDTSMHRMDHYTGRRCDKPTCDGKLKDSIIHFGENLPEVDLNNAFQHAEQADLCLVLGNYHSILLFMFVFLRDISITLLC